MENKTGKYLKYAIGEIILVVIGILIALSINNWNEAQKIKSSEQELLSSLLEEFRFNLNELERAINQNNRLIAKAEGISEFTGPIKIDINEQLMSDLFVGAFKSKPNYSPSPGVLGEILNSGKLEYISNQELRLKLAAWEPEVQKVKNQENWVSETSIIANSHLIKMGNFRRHVELVDSDWYNLPPSKFEDNNFDFLNSKQFENDLFLFIASSYSLNQNMYQPLKSYIENIILLIEFETKKV